MIVGNKKYFLECLKCHTNFECNEENYKKYTDGSGFSIFCPVCKRMYAGGLVGVLNLVGVKIKKHHETKPRSIHMSKWLLL